MPVGAARGRLRQVHGEPPGEAGRRPGQRVHGLPSALDSSSLFCLALGSTGSRGWFLGEADPAREAQSEPQGPRDG